MNYGRLDMIERAIDEAKCELLDIVREKVEGAGGECMFRCGRALRVPIAFAKDCAIIGMRIKPETDALVAVSENEYGDEVEYEAEEIYAEYLRCVAEYVA